MSKESSCTFDPMRWQIAQWAEVRWWKRYLNKQSAEGYLEWKRKYWRDLLSDLAIQTEKHEKVLDAGCGPSGIFMVFDEQHVTAIDPLVDSYRKELKLFDPSAYPWVNFVCSPIEKFNPTDQFDRLFCLNVINHVQRLEASIIALSNSLKEGGEFCISVDCHRWRLLKPLFQLIPWDVLHPHQYSLGDYVAMFEKRGLQVNRTHLIKSESIFNYYAIIGEKR